MKIEDINLFKKMHEAKKTNNMEEYYNIRNTIVEKNLKLVLSRVQHICGYQNEDLIEAGNESLINIIDRYDYTRGTEFSTFAVPWIDQGIHRELQKITTTVKIPYQKYEIVKRAIKRISMLNKEAKVQDISTMTGIKEDEVAQILEGLNTPVSLNYVPEDSDAELYDIINPNADNLEEQADNNIFKQEIIHFLNKCLSEQEVNVITLKYGIIDGKNKTLVEVGKILKITRERVRQIEKNALKKLNTKESKEQFSIYMDRPDMYNKKNSI